MRWIIGRGLLGSLLLLAAGLVYGRLPADSRLLASARLMRVRDRPDHLTLGLFIALAGLLLLTWAWLDLVRRVTGAPQGVRAVLWATAIWVLPLLVAPPLFSNDGWSYVATGYLAGHGLSPYAVTPSVLPHALLSGVDPAWRLTTSPYGPVPLVWGAVFSRITADPWLLMLAHRVLALLGLGLLATAVPRLARRAGRDPARATALAVASPLVVVHGVGGLHNDLLMVGLMATALSLTRRDRWLLGAVLTGLAAGVKLPGGVVGVGVVLVSLVPVATLSQRVRRGVGVALVAAGTLLAASFGSGLGLGWIGGLSVTADERAHLAPTAVLGHEINRLLRSFGPSGVQLIHRLHPVVTAKDLGLVLLAGALVWVFARWRVPDESAALCGAASALLAVILLSPALHYWYFLWALPLFACVALAARAERSLVALLAVLGPTAVADPAVHVRWLVPAALLALVLAPLVAWLTGGRAGDPVVGKEATPRRTLGRS